MHESPRTPCRYQLRVGSPALSPDTSDMVTSNADWRQNQRSITFSFGMHRWEEALFMFLSLSLVWDKKEGHFSTKKVSSKKVATMSCFGGYPKAGQWDFLIARCGSCRKETMGRCDTTSLPSMVQLKNEFALVVEIQAGVWTSVIDAIRRVCYIPGVERGESYFLACFAWFFAFSTCSAIVKDEICMGQEEFWWRGLRQAVLLLWTKKGSKQYVAFTLQHLKLVRVLTFTLLQCLWMHMDNKFVLIFVKSDGFSTSVLPSWSSTQTTDSRSTIWKENVEKMQLNMNWPEVCAPTLWHNTSKAFQTLV